jgi:hypothetical protein
MQLRTRHDEDITIVDIRTGYALIRYANGFTTWLHLSQLRPDTGHHLWGCAAAHQ